MEALRTHNPGVRRLQMETQAVLTPHRIQRRCQ